MLSEQLPQTDPGALARCRDSGQFVRAEQHSRNESAEADAVLVQEVQNAVWNDPILRVVDYNNIEIRVRNGMVSLYGHVVSGTNGQQAERAIRRVGGVTSIENHLIADDRLLAEVATGLGALEHGAGSKFFTGVSHGVVILSGTAGDTKTRLLAEQYAASNPHVRGVINSVRVRGSGPQLSDLPYLQPRTGTEFFFLDGISGRVQQVIIDPDNRRVIAMTLRGRFAEEGHAKNSLRNGGSQPPARTLVIPMVAVRYLTRHSGFLNILSTQADQYSEFNSADYLAPPARWEPPYPYCPSDVLFLLRQALAPTRVPERTESPIEVALAHQVLKDQLLENDSLGG